MEYRVDIYDLSLSVKIIEEAFVNRTGLNSILQKFTELTQSGRTKFVSSLIATGTSTYISDAKAVHRYEIIATDRTNKPKPPPPESPAFVQPSLFET